MGRLSPDYYCMDGTTPRRRLPEVLRRTAELSEEYGLPVVNVFHAGDGNMHPLILYDANKPGELERTEELGGKILELVRRGWRHHHRRTRCRHREDPPDVLSIHQGGARSIYGGQVGLRPE